MLPPQEPTPRQSRWRIVLRSFLLVVFVLLALVLLLLGTLHTRRGMTATVNLTLRLIRPWRGAEITVADARYGFLSGIELYGVHVSKRDAAFDARIDTLRVDYHLGDLTGRPLRIRSILVAGARVNARFPFPKEPTSSKAGGGSNLAFDRVELRRGSARLFFRTAIRDSVLELDGAALTGSGIRITQGVALTLDTLAATLRSPSPPAAMVRLSASGSMASERIVVRSLTIDGVRTRISGFGIAVLPTQEHPGYDGTDFRLTFAPLAGTDIRRFLPALGDPGDITLDLRARGDASALHTSLTARAQRGGTVDLDASLPPRGGKVELRTQGRIDDLDLDAILGKDLGKIRLTTQWSADLAGPGLAQISGPFTLDLTGANVRGAVLDQALLEGRFDDGRYAFHVTGRAAGYSVQGAGWVTPLATPRECNLSGILSVPPIRDADSACVFAGYLPFQVKGSMAKDSGATANATVDLRPDTSMSPILGPGRIALDLDPGRLRCRATILAASGSANIEGEVRLGKTPSFRIRDGVIRDVDIARLARDTTRCRLTAHFRGEGQGTRLESMRATAQLDSITFQYASHEIQNGSATVRLAGGRARADVDANVDGGTLKGWASVARWAPPREATTAVTFHDLDIARLTQQRASGRIGGTLSGNLARGTGRVDGRFEARSKDASIDGRLTAHASGTEARTLDGEATLDLSGSTIRRVTLDHCVTSLRLTHGHLDAGLHLQAGSDSAEIRVAGTPFDDPIQARATGTLRSERIAEILGADSLQARARLSFDAEGSMPRSGGMHGLRFSTRLTGSARASHRGIAQAATLDSLLVVGAFADGVMNLRQLLIRGNVLAADGAGRIAFPGATTQDSSSLHLEGTIGSLEPLGPILGVTNLTAMDGRFRVTAAGPAQETALSAHAALTRPHFNTLWADSLTVDLTGTTRDTTLADLGVRVAAGSLVVQPLQPRDVHATLGWNGTEASVEIHSMILSRWPEEIALQVTPLDGGMRAKLDRLVHTMPSGTIALQNPVELEVGKRLSLSSLVLTQDGVPMLRAHGGVKEDGTLEFEVAIDSLDLKHVEDFIDLPSMGGSVSLNGSLRGTRELPILDASLQTKLIPNDRKPANVDGRLQWAGGGLDVNAGFEQTPTNRIHLDARIPVALTLAPKPGARNIAPASGPMRAKLEAKSFDLSWFQSLLSPRQVRNLQGWVDGTVTAEGNPDRPDLTGGLTLQKARVELPPLGIKLEDGIASLGFSGRTARLERATVKSGGTMEASGTLKMLGPGNRPLDLEVMLHHFVPVNTSQAEAHVDGKISVTGDFNAPRVRSELTLRNSTVYAERGERGGLEPVALTRRDLLDLEERFGVGMEREEQSRSSFSDSTDLDVSVKIGDNVWVRRHSDPVVALELKGDVRVRKPAGGALGASGTLGIRTGRSYLSFMGRRFDMQSADVALPGPIQDASARLEAFYHPRPGTTSTEVDVTATVEITASGITTNLRSEPYLDQSSLLNYLATGQVQGGLESGSAYGLAVGTALGAVGGAAGRSLGLDVVTVTTDAYGGQTLGAGSYVNPKVYLGFRQPVVEGKRSGTSSASSSSNTEFEFEVEAMRNLLFNIQGSSAQYRFVLRPRLGR